MEHEVGQKITKRVVNTSMAIEGKQTFVWGSEVKGFGLPIIGAPNGRATRDANN
jgi:hypothetical protein